MNTPRGGGSPRGRPGGRGGNNLVGTIPTPTATPVAQSPLPPPQPQLQPPQPQQQPTQSPLQRVAPQHTMNGLYFFKLSKIKLEILDPIVE